MIPLHALVLILMGRYSNRLYVAYSSWYSIGTLASMQVPFVGFQPVRTSEHMAALGNLLCSIYSLTFVHLLPRCIRTFANCRLRTASPFSHLLKTIPATLVCDCGDHWHPRFLCHCRTHVQGLDCAMDWSFLLIVGHRLC